MRLLHRVESALLVLVVLRGLSQRPLPGPACSLLAERGIEGGSPRKAPDLRGERLQLWAWAGVCPGDREERAHLNRFKQDRRNRLLQP